jgi:hypothetical protein
MTYTKNWFLFWFQVLFIFFLLFVMCLNNLFANWADIWNGWKRDGV